MKIDNLLQVMDTISCNTFNCGYCPYRDIDECVYEIRKDLTKALERLKFIEEIIESNEIDKLIIAVEHIHCSPFHCDDCPDRQEDFCELKLQKKLRDALRRLKFLEARVIELEKADAL